VPNTPTNPATSEGLFLRLKPELVTRLRVHAATTRQSLSAVVAEALDRYLRTKEKG
jgi:predicted HicB family RNase H-like nuclease